MIESSPPARRSLGCLFQSVYYYVQYITYLSIYLGALAGENEGSFFS